MSNGSEACCALGICCPPLSAKQIDTLARAMAEDTGMSVEYCQTAADYILHKFDLAPQGSLEQFKHDIATMARKHGS